MVDIIVVTYNARNELKRCLKSVEKYTKGIRYLLTIVNNDSTDGTSRFLKNYQKKNKNINIIHTGKNLGFCGGANLALRNTYNKFIALLDDDVEVTKGWLVKLCQQIKKKSNIGIVGCKIVFPDNKIWSAEYRVRPPELAGWGERDKGQRDYIKECDALAGPCWLMKRGLIKKVGYFDERFFPCQCEDIDYCLRTRLAGNKIIYNGKVKIIHHHLYRDKGQFRKNLQKFLKGWRNILPAFPLKDSHPVDKFLADGVDYLKKERFNQALTEFKKAEAIDKGFSEPLYNGLVLKGLKKFDKAIIEFKKYLSLNPLSYQTHYYLASTYKEIGKIRESRKEYIKSINSLIQCRNLKKYAI